MEALYVAEMQTTAVYVTRNKHMLNRPAGGGMCRGIISVP